MKKYMKIFFVIFIILITLLSCVGCSSLKGEKILISTDTFISVAESNKYNIVDVDSDYENIEEVKNVITAIKHGDNNEELYEIKFFELDTLDSSIRIFNNAKKRFESQTGNVTMMKISLDFGNYSRYSLISNGKYMFVSRIDNTVVFADVDQEYKDKVNEFIEGIGY